jgi:hypothetical protein
MPPFEGQIDEEGVLHLIAYIKSLSNPPPSQGGARGGIGDASNTPPVSSDSASNENPSPDLSVQGRGEQP